MEQFRAYRIHAQNDHASGQFDHLSFNDLCDGDVVIRVQHSSINYKDALAATGVGKIMKKFPLVGGIDAAGVVVSSDNKNVQPGDDVLVTGCGLGETHDGGYAEFARVRHEWVVPIPEGMSSWDVMCLGTAGFTAGLAIQRMEYNGQTPDKGPVVVTGATGGVGSFAIDMLAGLGYEVVALTSKRDQIDYLKKLGAKQVLLRQDMDFGSSALDAAKWAGAIDNVGGETLSWLTRTVGWWGNIACVGMASSADLHTTVLPLILRGINLLGINSMATPRPERLAVWKRLATDLKPKHLELIGHRTVDFDDIADHFNEFIDGKVTGRTVVKISN
ncbi:MAG: oxidoreductase [Gammaproteobacteria bacterium]|nr:oxidoreductase [Gammaproteobacteria bacterium]